MVDWAPFNVKGGVETAFRGGVGGGVEVVVTVLGGACCGCV